MCVVHTLAEGCDVERTPCRNSPAQLVSWSRTCEWCKRAVEEGCVFVSKLIFVRTFMMLWQLPQQSREHRGCTGIPPGLSQKQKCAKANENSPEKRQHQAVCESSCYLQAKPVKIKTKKQQVIPPKGNRKAARGLRTPPMHKSPHNMHVPLLKLS